MPMQLDSPPPELLRMFWLHSHASKRLKLIWFLLFVMCGCLQGEWMQPPETVMIWYSGKRFICGSDSCRQAFTRNASTWIKDVFSEWITHPSKRLQDSTQVRPRLKYLQERHWSGPPPQHPSSEHMPSHTMRCWAVERRKACKTSCSLHQWRKVTKYSSNWLLLIQHINALIHEHI